MFLLSRTAARPSARSSFHSAAFWRFCILAGALEAFQIYNPEREHEAHGGARPTTSLARSPFHIHKWGGRVRKVSLLHQTNTNIGARRRMDGAIIFFKITK